MTQDFLKNIKTRVLVNYRKHDIQRWYGYLWVQNEYGYKLTSYLQWTSNYIKMVVESVKILNQLYLISKNSRVKLLTN